MSRQILFRGKRVDNGEWVEGFLIMMDTENCPALAIGKDYYSLKQIIPETVGQLTDTIGEIKVFEGDIFGFKDSTHVYFVRIEDSFQAVCYHTRYFTDLENKEHMRWGHFYRIKELGFEDRFYLIGNVYDNPELIRKEANNV